MPESMSLSMLSADLRAALDLPAGAPPPWQARLLAFGVPIDYRSIEPDPEKPVKVGACITVELDVPRCHSNTTPLLRLTRPCLWLRHALAHKQGGSKSWMTA